MKVLLLSSAAVLLLVLPVCAQESTTSATPVAVGAAVAKTREYVISPDDMLEVYIVDVPELSRTYRVSPGGTVVVPLLPDAIPAAGLTLPEFSQSLGDELQKSGVVSRPHVTTSVQQSRLHSVAVTGAVRKPQIYPLLAPSTLMDVLTQAEGLADDAGTSAIIYRGDLAVQALALSDGGTEAAEAARTTTVDLKRVLESGDPNANVSVYPGDRVTVPRAGIVYVVGAVNRPGGFPIRPNKQAMTVLQAVALAEDVKSTAIPTRTVIIRTDPAASGGRRQIPVDLKQVFSGKATDPALQADDILFVPDSQGKKALRRGIEAVLQTASGVLIFRP